MSQQGQQSEPTEWCQYHCFVTLAIEAYGCRSGGDSLGTTPILHEEWFLRFVSSSKLVLATDGQGFVASHLNLGTRSSWFNAHSFDWFNLCFMSANFWLSTVIWVVCMEEGSEAKRVKTHHNVMDDNNNNSGISSGDNNNNRDTQVFVSSVDAVTKTLTQALHMIKTGEG